MWPLGPTPSSKEGPGSEAPGICRCEAAIRDPPAPTRPRLPRAPLPDGGCPGRHEPAERQERHSGGAAANREHRGPALERAPEGGDAEEARGSAGGHEGVLFRLL